MTETTQPAPTPQQVDAIVIGGGVTGLGIAHTLARKGKSVRLIERSNRLGGAVQSENRKGFLCEAGPNSMLVKSQAVWQFIHELGLKDRLVEANAVANKRFLVKNGVMTALPQSLAGGVTTPLYSLAEKFRLLAEPFIGKSTMEDESVTSFVSRRMGPAFLEYGISALVSGIYAGDPDALSIRHAFGKVWNLEQSHGSLIGGALKLKRERKRNGITPFKSRMISFQDGLRELVEALASVQGLGISTGSDISSITREGDGSWTVRWTEGSCTGRQLVLATSLDAYRDLPFEADAGNRLASIDIPDHPPLSTLVLGYDRDKVEHPLDGFGVLCPRMEKRFGLGAIFSSTLFPGRAPEGKVSLMCFIGGVQQPGNGELPTSQLVERTVEDLRPLIGLKGGPCFTSHTFWPRAIPQYNVGYQSFLDSLAKVESQLPGLHLHGNFRGGPGLNDCLESALRFAGDID
ncbi:MAG: protoporphyrinogen oxidase [Opitutales bacterium]|jgi:oxygen-dependent protoporphyrinogen oxidase